MGNCCSSPVRSSPSSPLLMGEPNGHVDRVRVLVATAGLKMYDIHWVTGTAAAARVAAGTFAVI